MGIVGTMGAVGGGHMVVFLWVGLGVICPQWGLCEQKPVVCSGFGGLQTVCYSCSCKGNSKQTVSQQVYFSRIVGAKRKEDGTMMVFTKFATPASYQSVNVGDVLVYQLVTDTTAVKVVKKTPKCVVFARLAQGETVHKDGSVVYKTIGDVDSCNSTYRVQARQDGGLFAGKGRYRLYHAPEIGGRPVTCTDYSF